MLNRKKRTLRAAALVCLAAVSTLAGAAQRTYSGLEVDVVTNIRVADGKFDDYMRLVAKDWKREVEALLKAGVISRWEVVTDQPAGPDQGNLMLIVAYNNYAGMDGAPEKTQAVLAKLYGSAAAAEEAAAQRAKIGRVLGVRTMQILQWK